MQALEVRALGANGVPETLGSSLQLSEGPVIASIHEKRDEFRAQIQHEGQLDEKPKLKSRALPAA